MPAVRGVFRLADYPDWLAYDPAHGTIWTTNEQGGSETIVDAATGAPRETVPLGGEAGNVAYDPATVAAESGWVTVLDRHGRQLHTTVMQHLAEGAHVVAADPATGRSYYPVPHATGGRPAVLVAPSDKRPFRRHFAL